MNRPNDSLFHKIRSGQITLEAFQRQLTEYNSQRLELIESKDKFGPDLYKNRLRELELQISFTQIFIDKFDSIKTA